MIHESCGGTLNWAMESSAAPALEREQEARRSVPLHGCSRAKGGVLRPISPSKALPATSAYTMRIGMDHCIPFLPLRLPPAVRVGKRALWILANLTLLVFGGDALGAVLAQDDPARERRLAVARPDADAVRSGSDDRRRIVIETDAGGDPDDEQSLVRFLLYANEWDVEAIIANRAVARDRENRNPERTGLGIVRRLVDAYAACWPRLRKHDPRYPAPETIRARTFAGYDHTDEAVNALIAIVDRPDPRPVWYSDWGSDRGSSTNNLRRALDRVLRERGAEGYAAFKRRLRLSSSDAFGPHTYEIEPPFPLWVDTWRPEREGRRWYHRFSALTSRAGGFDVVRDVLQDHGPLGAMYPTNTTHWCKEGDTVSFLYLVPNGLNAPEHPGWGGWGGRLNLQAPDSRRPYFWSDQVDAWNGSTNRDNTLLRWAADLQNDFRTRLDWCVQPRAGANHAPVVRVEPSVPETVVSGTVFRFSARASTDPDGDTLSFDWIPYPEAGTWNGKVEYLEDGAELTLTVPEVTSPETLHFIVRVADSGVPSLARYERVVITAMPRSRPLPDFAVPGAGPIPTEPPAGLERDLGAFRDVLRFEDGRPVRTPAEWAERRREILKSWHAIMGPWPALLARPKVEVIRSERQEGDRYERRRVRLELAANQFSEGWLLVPDGAGPFPAVLVPFYEPETSIGQGRPQRDFARQLTRRGFVTLSIGSPGGDARVPDTAGATCQPLSFLAYLAANAANALAEMPEVDAKRLGIVGHSYGGKWALFGACLYDRFAAGAWSDPGIVWDETRPNVNYWDVWYLGKDSGVERKPGVPGPANPATGAYPRLVERGHDLHELMALMAPRPFLVSGGSEDPAERWRALNHVRAVNRLLGVGRRVGMTLRPAHDPTEGSNAQLVAFFEAVLGP